MTKKETPHIPKQRQTLINIFLYRNQQINLSAIRNPEEVYIKHILDSLELGKIFSLGTFHNATLVDLWTWGGFPLLPLAIQYPHLQCIWLDARKKKCFAIEQIVKELWLSNVQTLRSRAEEAKLQVDILTARAVAYADKLFQRALPLVKTWGFLVFYKLFTPEEDHDIHSLIQSHHLELQKTHRYFLPDDKDKKERIIYIIKK